MTNVSKLLVEPGVAKLLQTLVVSEGGANITGVHLAEGVEDLERAPAGSLVVLSHVASQAATGYRLDLAVRAASVREAAAVVLTDGRDAVPTTASNIARDAGLALLVADASADLVAIILAVSQELGGGPDAALDE